MLFLYLNDLWHKLRLLESWNQCRFVPFCSIFYVQAARSIQAYLHAVQFLDLYELRFPNVVKAFFNYIELLAAMLLCRVNRPIIFENIDAGLEIAH